MTEEVQTKLLAHERERLAEAVQDLVDAMVKPQGTDYSYWDGDKVEYEKYETSPEHRDPRSWLLAHGVEHLEPVLAALVAGSRSVLREYLRLGSLDRIEALIEQRGRVLMALDPCLIFGPDSRSGLTCLDITDERFKPEMRCQSCKVRAALDRPEES